MNDVVVALLLGGLMGLVGQATRAVIGIKKLSDTAADSEITVSDLFSAVRFGVSLVIGFIAGMIGAITIGLDKVSSVGTTNVDILLGLAAAGYAGTDAIEAFSTRVTGTQGSTPASSSSKNDLLSGKQLVLATHLVGAERILLSADDIIGRINDASRAPPENSQPKPSEPVPDAQPSGRAIVINHVPANVHGHQKELAEALKYKAAIKSAADQCGIEALLICAIGSRESAWGLTLKPPGPAGTGDFAPRNPAKWGYRLPPDGRGWGRGLMQVDYQQEFAKTGDWANPTANILHGAKELADNIAYFRKSGIDNLDHTRAGIAAYNCGRGNVMAALRNGLDIDYYTTGHDYSADVLKRMDWFRDHGFEDQVAV